MDGGGAEEETEAEVAEKVCDGLEIMAAFCAIDRVELRRSVKRIVLALSGQAAGAPDWSRLRAYAASMREPAPAQADVAHADEDDG